MTAPITFTVERLAAMTPEECAEIAAAFFLFGASKLDHLPKRPPAHSPKKRSKKPLPKSRKNP